MFATIGNNTARNFGSDKLEVINVNGVSDGARTHDPQDHNLMLYQLSYAHRKWWHLNFFIEKAQTKM